MKRILVLLWLIISIGKLHAADHTYYDEYVLPVMHQSKAYVKEMLGKALYKESKNKITVIIDSLRTNEYLFRNDSMYHFTQISKTALPKNDRAFCRWRYDILFKKDMMDTDYGQGHWVEDMNLGFTQGPELATTSVFRWFYNNTVIVFSTMADANYLTFKTVYYRE